MIEKGGLANSACHGLRLGELVAAEAGHLPRDEVQAGSTKEEEEFEA